MRIAEGRLKQIIREEARRILEGAVTDYDRAFDLFRSEWDRITAAAQDLFHEDESSARGHRRSGGGNDDASPLAAHIRQNHGDLYVTLLRRTGGDRDDLAALLAAAYRELLPEIQYDVGSQDAYEDYMYRSRYS